MNARQEMRDLTASETFMPVPLLVAQGVMHEATWEGKRMEVGLQGGTRVERDNASFIPLPLGEG